MKHGQLFAGIGGFGLAAQWMGWQNVWANEIDPYCCKLLRQNFPETKIYEQDIREIGGHNLNPVDIVSGGFPCQPFSSAGNQKGEKDDRYLWPENIRILRELKPVWYLGENVADIVTMDNGRTFKRVVSDLENEGYKTESYIIPASAIGAEHRRNRVWIVAHSDRQLKPFGFFDRNGRESKKRGENQEVRGKDREFIKMGTTIDRTFRYTEEFSEPLLVGRNDGIPNVMDRIKGLGNAIVPQVAYEIFKAIEAKNQENN